jgi:hypothetical protein
MLLILVLMTAGSYAQDSVSVTKKPDTSSVKSVHNPIKAAWLAAVLPGAGQIYNKKFWKLPILYGAAGACGFFIVNNHREYVVYRDILRNRKADTTFRDQFFGLYSNDQVRILRDFYLRNRDFTVILSVLLYIVQIVDAHVDAHLMTFDVSEKLTLKSSPFIQTPSPGMGFNAGLHLSLHFR